jgi:hypothetical protein
VSAGADGSPLLGAVTVPVQRDDTPRQLVGRRGRQRWQRIESSRRTLFHRCSMGQGAIRKRRKPRWPRGFRRIGETGFEPATARPPVAPEAFCWGEKPAFMWVAGSSDGVSWSSHWTPNWTPRPWRPSSRGAESANSALTGTRRRRGPAPLWKRPFRPSVRPAPIRTAGRRRCQRAASRGGQQLTTGHAATFLDTAVSDLAVRAAIA